MLVNLLHVLVRPILLFYDRSRHIVIDNWLKMAMDPFDFPPELCSRPLALIGLTGLDTLNNAVHRTIWDAFSSNRRQYRAPVQFKLLDPAHEFPPMKPKRTSYDWYIPKGILKRNWMNKHLNEMPAVVVIFYELDWDDPFWNEKSIECSSRVQSVRAALEGRSTRIAVILVQQTAPLPTGEDMLAAERAAALCTSCELNSKSLFVLPHGDHLQGYTHRLENAFYDLAQNYYHHESRNIKAHRDHLNKTTHQYLFVRHLFKIGFLNELKQDGHTALKNYTQAYNNVLELRLVDTNALEVKTVAGFINYKLCKLMFQLSLPRDAIAQFRRHTDLFKNRIGPKNLVFEHHAWMSKQFCVFGDIFDEAIRQGLPALQTQHPGFYYQQAAQHAADRKEACLELCKAVNVYPEPDPLIGMEHLEFYGQRAWRPGKLSAEPPDPDKEKLGIVALQYQEKHLVNHSMIIIGLLGSAITQFKTYHCPRMRRHLVVQMAEEYYSSRDYGKALTLLTHMLWDYRCEKWWRLITNILTLALNCAYLSASIHDYVVLSLEALGTSSQFPFDQKTRIFNNFMKKTAPDPEPDVHEDEMKHARDLWITAVNAEPLEIAVDMSNITACVESKARFTQPQYKADQYVEIEVFIRSSCPHPLQFSRLSVTVNNPNYSSEFAVCESSSQEAHASGNPLLLFRCNEVRSYVCRFLPDVQDVGKEIQIGSILLHLGSDKERSAILRFNGTGAETATSDGMCPELQHFRQSPQNMPDFDNVRPLSTTEIISRDSKLKLDILHAFPALLGEWYPIRITLENEENHKITGVSANIVLQTSGDEPNIEQSTQLCEDLTAESMPVPVILSVGDLEKDSSTEKCFYLRAHRVGNRNIAVKVTYTMIIKRDSERVENSCVKEEMINVPVVKPFDITAKFFSLRFEPIAKTFAKEPFIVMPYVNCASPCPLIIEDSSVELSQQVCSVDAKLESQLQSLRLKNGETGAEAFCVSVSEPSDQPVALGIYTLKWKREGSNGLVTSSSVTMPTVRVESAPLYVEMILPAHGWVRTPMAVSYHIHNYTTRLLQLELSMEASDAFMFAGHKQLKLRILPESVHKMDYNLYPLLSGLVALPRLRLTISDEIDMPIRQPQLTELLDRSLPSHVFVMPQGKGNPVAIKVVS
ncbi:trafficking protein particle complex subunit 11 isoform X2 [Zootermopsis nevadensis]|uniref:trafficking protein particle complex subunit 11 isoform X2 n=1 Tax=Zootermopsis nevadensis TaxID=136037 RepID=UPI000B8E24B1|nr:trafficking protein particle complex subunit 11 isoform X2 [Zootermopsis nevadensis]